MAAATKPHPKQSAWIAAGAWQTTPKAQPAFCTGL